MAVNRLLAEGNPQRGIQVIHSPHSARRCCLLSRFPFVHDPRPNRRKLKKPLRYTSLHRGGHAGKVLWMRTKLCRFALTLPCSTPKAVKGIFHYRNNSGAFVDSQKHFYRFGALQRRISRRDKKPAPKATTPRMGGVTCCRPLSPNPSNDRGVRR